MPSMTSAGYVPPKQPKKPAKKPAAGKKKRKKKSGMSAAAVVSLVIFLAACLLGAGTIYVYTISAPYAQAFLPGTMLLGYPLGGATMEEARGLLHQMTQQDINSFEIELTWENQSYVLSGADLSLSIDEEATLSPLWARGREGGMLGRFAQMLALAKEPMITHPVVTYDMAAADELLALVEQDIACAPEDAAVSFTPGSAEPFAFTPETIGYSLDLAPVRAQIETAAQRVEAAVIELAPQMLMPERTLEDLRAATVLRSRVLMEIDAQEAAYANVSLAAAALSGLCIEAGETLSFNETVGARSASRGYQSAPEPAYGIGVSGVGGGVCQLSSALYRLALLGEMDVPERSAAVYPVAYCEMGQEAAVSDQGIDLKIKNTTDYPMFVSARVYRDDKTAWLELQLIGQPLENRRALVSGVTQETMNEEPVYVRDHEGRYARYEDERAPAGEAMPGYTVVVDLVTTDKDGSELSRREVSVNEYAPVPPAIYVGVEKRD